jgi:hypothetical protein
MSTPSVLWWSRPLYVCCCHWLSLTTGAFINWMCRTRSCIVLEDDVYMKRSPEYHSLGHPDYVCKLDKVIYGQKQALLVWYSCFSTKLLQLWFQASKADTSSSDLCWWYYRCCILGSGGPCFAFWFTCWVCPQRLWHVELLSRHRGQEVWWWNCSYTRQVHMDILKQVGMTSCKPSRTSLTADEKLSWWWWSVVSRGCYGIS